VYEGRLSRPQLLPERKMSAGLDAADLATAELAAAADPAAAAELDTGATLGMTSVQAGTSAGAGTVTVTAAAAGKEGVERADSLAAALPQLQAS